MAVANGNQVSGNSQGLIQTAIDSGNSNQVLGAQTNTLDATLRTVDPAKETVAGQLSSILSSGSPLMQQAKSGAMETANSRGLLNSSMAAGAGQSAMIAAAAPIATSDASVYGSTAKDNNALINNAATFNATAANASNTAAAQAGNILIGQGMKGDQSVTLAQIEANYKQLMQSSASASQFFNNIANNITTITNDVNTSQAQKDSAVQNQNAILQSGLTVIGSIANVDIAGLLNFANAAAGTAVTP